MKRKYMDPELEVIKLEAENDIVRCSTVDALDTNSDSGENTIKPKAL